MNIQTEFESVLRCIPFVHCCLFLQQLSFNGKLIKLLEVTRQAYTELYQTYFILFFNTSWLNRDSVLMLKGSYPFMFDFAMVFISLPLLFINICIMHFLL